MTKKSPIVGSLAMISFVLGCSGGATPGGNLSTKDGGASGEWGQSGAHPQETSQPEKLILDTGQIETDVHVMASFKPPVQREKGGLMSVEQLRAHASPVRSPFWNDDHRKMFSKVRITQQAQRVEQKSSW